MIQNNVFLRKEDHRYFDLSNNEYRSVSAVLNEITEKFDAEVISKRCAGKGKYAGMTALEVKTQWAAIGKNSAEHGTNIHDALERFSKHAEILEEDVHLTPMIQTINADYREYRKVHDECILYHPEYKVAGTADKVLELGTRKIYADIEDYKTNNRKGIEYFSGYNKYFFEPVNHFSDCNFNRYALQLSIYGVMYERLTGNKIRSLWIRSIPPDNMLNHKRIPVPYLKSDAMNILENFSGVILKSKPFEIPSF